MGKNYGYLGIVDSYRNDSISAFYLNGYIYNGYSPDGSALERIDLETGAVGSLALSSPIFDRDGDSLIGPSSNLLITTDGKNIVLGATGLGGGTNGYKIAVFNGETGALAASRGAARTSNPRTRSAAHTR